MNATTHPVAPEEIMAFLDGELTADRAQFISAHVEECSECHGVVASIRNTSQSLTNWTVEAGLTSPDVEARLADTARNESSKPRPARPAQVRAFLRRHWLLAGAGSVVAVGAVLAFSITMFRPMGMARLARQDVPVDFAVTDRLPITDQQGKVLSNKTRRGRPVAGLDALVTQATPGVAADSNGLYHGLGDHAEYSFYSGPMIARMVSLSVVVKDFEAGRAALDTILARHNGYAANLNASTPQGAARTLQASLRIPAPQLVSALAELKALGRVEGESQNGEEVTQQHADLVARIKNDRETELRLQDILRTRTGKVKDVLDVEQEIARVRGEIEQMEAEQKALEHRVDFATIDLKLAEEYKAQLSSPAPSVLMQLRNATVNGFRNAFESLLGIVLFFAESGPTLILWLAIFAIPAWLLWRRYRRAHTLASLVGA
jgi:hypothetical protein